MSSPIPLIAIGLLAAGFCHAKELAIKSKPFEIVHELEAKAMPTTDVPLIRIDAKAWSSFPITELAEHGSLVEKGDVLIAMETRMIDKEIEKLERQVESQKLAIAEAADHLAKLEETAARRLEAAKRAATQSQEELDYFTQTGRMAEQEEALHSIKRNEQWLANQREELRQLKQMYEADDLTEDTEEIILVRQQNAVESAELMLRLAKLRQTRQVEVMLPRKAEALSEAAATAAVELKYTEREIPHQIEQAKAKLKELEADALQNSSRLADLEHDRQLFEIKAKVAGTFYHGAIEDGKWTTGDLLRGLEVGGSAPRHKAFASLVPAEVKLQLVAHTDAAKARQLTEDVSGLATLKGTEILGADASAVPVSVSESSLISDPTGRHQVTFQPEWPEDIPVAVGNPATLQVLVYENPAAIVIPAKALNYSSKGWSVELRLADGKAERRTVTRGAQSGDEVEILSGLELGQVILVP